MSDRRRSPDRGGRRGGGDDRRRHDHDGHRHHRRGDDNRDASRERRRDDNGPQRRARRRSPSPPSFFFPADHRGCPASRPAPPPPPPPRPDPRFDFLSPAAFDALAALTTPGVAPPVPHAASLDTVEQCLRLLPPDLPESAAARRAARAKEAAATAAASGPGRARAGGGGQPVGGREGLQPAPDLVPKRRPPPPRPAASAATAAARYPGGTLAAIAAAAAGADPSAPAAAASPGAGPLALLLRLARTPGAHARVVTRHARGVRGVALGTLVSFDRHCNLVLADVEETYSVRVWGERGKAGKGGEEVDGGKTKVRPHLEPRSRRLRLVFVRGDSVVLVGDGGGERK